MKKKESMNNWKEIVGSPIWWVPVSLLVLFISIEGLHLAEHGKNCRDYIWPSMVKTVKRKQLG